MASPSNLNIAHHPPGMGGMLLPFPSFRCATPTAALGAIPFLPYSPSLPSNDYFRFQLGESYLQLQQQQRHQMMLASSQFLMNHRYPLLPPFQMHLPAEGYCFENWRSSPVPSASIPRVNTSTPPLYSTGRSAMVSSSPLKTISQRGKDDEQTGGARRTRKRSGHVGDKEDGEESKKKSKRIRSAISSSSSTEPTQTSAKGDENQKDDMVSTSCRENPIRPLTDASRSNDFITSETNTHTSADIGAGQIAHIPRCDSSLNTVMEGPGVGKIQPPRSSTPEQSNSDSEDHLVIDFSTPSPAADVFHPEPTTLPSPPLPLPPVEASDIPTDSGHLNAAFGLVALSQSGKNYSSQDPAQLTSRRTECAFESYSTHADRLPGGSFSERSTPHKTPDTRQKTQSFTYWPGVEILQNAYQRHRKEQEQQRRSLLTRKSRLTTQFQNLSSEWKSLEEKLQGSLNVVAELQDERRRVQDQLRRLKECLMLLPSKQKNTATTLLSPSTSGTEDYEVSDDGLAPHSEQSKML